MTAEHAEGAEPGFIPPDLKEQNAKDAMDAKGREGLPLGQHRSTCHHVIPSVSEGSCLRHSWPALRFAH